ncbi:hypothetical protein KIN20_001691 [Parelaphostrongylus tenuis]|uniref:Uncharacterized protein n=1 Tax=Parelaphostrongylus tenuis TaxID=148309 RepID=A0AAD5LWJ6_PARTN|nr:hypothetical protein KIN20_001691 [Parelaphostrongylus tenuis]
MAAIVVNSLLTGYFYLVGANYCHCPMLMYITGAIVLGLWCGTCMNCFLLVINRLMDLSSKHLIRMLAVPHHDAHMFKRTICEELVEFENEKKSLESKSLFKASRGYVLPRRVRQDVLRSHSLSQHADTHVGRFVPRRATSNLFSYCNGGVALREKSGESRETADFRQHDGCEKTNRWSERASPS